MKYWFITGISSGLGKALASSVLKRGDFVIGTFRNQSQVDLFNLKNTTRAYAILLDITDFTQIENCIHKLISDFGRIDVIVNNAGVGIVGSIEETSIQETRNVFETNFFGALRITQLILPYMRKAKSGHIVQISSHGGIKASAGFGIYNASKFALEGFSEALAQELLPLGITVTIVEPGPFRTKFAGKGLIEAKEIIDDYKDTAGVFRLKLKNIDGKQEGDPSKAASTIIEKVYSQCTSLRLPLGKIALKTIKLKMKSVESDLEVNREIAEKAVFE